jgi:hypothetical protein
MAWSQAREPVRHARAYGGHPDNQSTTLGMAGTSPAMTKNVRVGLLIKRRVEHDLALALVGFDHAVRLNRPR